MIEMSTRLTMIDQKIHNAMRAIDIDGHAQDSTRQAIHRFAEKSEKTLEELDRENTAVDALLKDVMELEDLGDQAKDCAKVDYHSRHLAERSLQAVVDAHNSISELKAELRGTANPG